MTGRAFPEPLIPGPASRRAAFPRTIRYGEPLRAVVLGNLSDPTPIALAALAELGIATRRAGFSEAIDPDDVDLAVVLADETTSSDRIKETITRLRVGGLAVLVLASDVNDDVLLQDCAATKPPQQLVSLELARRMRNLLRDTSPRPLRFGSLVIDILRRQVTFEGEPVDLRRREFDLLVFLASSPERAFTRRELLVAVWHSSGDWQTVSTVTEHIRRLRAKLPARPGATGWIVTVRGVGYRFNPCEPAHD